MNNKKIGLMVLGIVILAGAFYGGMVYGKSQIPVRLPRGQGGQGFAGGGLGARGGFTTGQVIAKDDKSITVQLMSGGSKIIFLDTNTKIMKLVAGMITDLAIGTQVSVMGAPNADGSINATNVQIRQNMAPAVVK